MPGLTGVVGPNGCGKSNVIEALRWAMGEANARNMRGTEMEDVILPGLPGAPRAIWRKSTLTLEETAGLAPPPFHEAADLEISRKIERGSGSSYRVNGKEARARDVQTLFADLASGARASAMISQGRVGSLVNARPDERRALLEEAAGITGLHARRHEAELKLKAAEQNLGRADDLKGQIEARLAELKKQARQATRYRNLSGNIRAAEAELLAIQRALATAARDAAQAEFALAETRVTEATIAAEQAATAAAETEAALPELRTAESHARTALERARIASEQSAEVETRARASLSEARTRLEALTRDHGHATKLVADAQAAQTRLEEEQTRLLAEVVSAPAALEEAGRAEDAAFEAMREAEAEANRATEDAAHIAAESEAARRALAEAEQRARRASLRAGEAQAEYQKIAATLIAQERVEAARPSASRRKPRCWAREAVTAAEAARALAEEEAAAARAEAETALAAARAKTATANSAATKIVTEFDALTALLAQKFGRESAPILDRISVPRGSRRLWARRCGRSFQPARMSGPRGIAHAPPLDLAVVPLDPSPDLVQGPDALKRALAVSCCCPRTLMATSTRATLPPAGCLVSREGAVWRWDGSTVRAGAACEAAVRLKQRNRLAQLERERNATQDAAAQARQERVTAETAEREARASEAAIREARRAAETAAREARRAAEHHFDRSRSEAIRLTAEAERGNAKAAHALVQRDQTAAEAEEAAAAFAAVKEKAANLPDVNAARAAVEKARVAVAQARQAESVARQKFEVPARRRCCPHQAAGNPGQ